MLTATADNQRGPRFTEQVLANLGGIPFDLLILPVGRAASLAIRCKAKHHHVIVRELQAAYPDLRITKRSEEQRGSGKSSRLFLSLAPTTFLIRTHESFRNELDGMMSDPVAALLAAIAPKSDTSTVFSIAVECRPMNSRRKRRFLRRCDLEGDPEKGKHQLFRCRVVLSGLGQSSVVHRGLKDIAGAFGQFTSGTLTEFKRRWKIRARCVLNDSELATLWHPTTLSVKSVSVTTNDSRQIDAPISVGSGKDSNEAVLGTRLVDGRSEPFSIKRDDRRRHLAIVGKTGMGKSTLLMQLIESDMKAGRGVGLIDPHGDLSEEVLSLVPKHRTGDVVLLDAGDREFPPAFDPLHCGQGSDISLTASGVVSALKKLYGDSWGPRLEYILRNAVLALLEVEGTSLLSLMRMLSDKQFRNRIVNQVRDPLVRAFWIDEFAKKPARWQEEAVAPIQNKVGQFLSSPLLRNIVGQVPGRIDLRGVMDQEGILIANLSKGRIGEDGATLLGALLVTGLQQAAMSRSDIPEKARRDFYLYVDEFQNFATDSFATILSEARKYRLSLTIANQYLDQIDDATRNAVFGNVGSILSFQVGTTDAAALAPQLAGDIQSLDLISLPKYEAYIRLLVDGMPSKPFSMRTMKPKVPSVTDRVEKIRRTSRRQHSRPVDEAAKLLKLTR